MHGCSSTVRHLLEVLEGPSTQYLRTLVPKTIPLMAFGTRVPRYWVLGPSGSTLGGPGTRFASEPSTLRLKMTQKPYRILDPPMYPY